jgi:hypothetical protein
MPLKPGYKHLKDNIKELMKAGYPQKQAVAISLDVVKKGRGK